MRKSGKIVVGAVNEDHQCSILRITTTSAKATEAYAQFIYHRCKLALEKAGGETGGVLSFPVDWLHDRAGCWPGASLKH